MSEPERMREDEYLRMIVAVPDLLAELRQCKTELEEAANLFRSSLPGMARIYTAAAERVAATIAKATGAA